MLFRSHQHHDGTGATGATHAQVGAEIDEVAAQPFAGGVVAHLGDETSRMASTARSLHHVRSAATAPVDDPGVGVAGVVHRTEHVHHDVFEEVAHTAEHEVGVGIPVRRHGADHTLVAMSDHSVKQQMQTALTAAMKARDEIALSALRQALSAMAVAETSGSEQVVLSDEQALAVIAVEVRKHHETADAFVTAGRPEKTEREDRKSTRLNSSHIPLSRMPSSA